ncbi:hypothetical protein [Gordonia sp. NB41Y]|uniref:hypothetical protein n=1 Tax=Gordonia sp. NB41Y TaxID=875808 RepID=UPI0002C0160B|nr:hypothetical protein [Gordonia sp. NB41Y]WLP91289.1 hypothetical protein Q9K23_03185 [Gordonia sp. NB41Y]
MSPTPPSSLFNPLSRLFGSDSNRFGVDPDQISALSDTWRSQGNAVGGIGFDALTVDGEGSRVITALRATGKPALAATESISDRLISMAVALEAFSATSETQDDSVAHVFDLMTDR